VLVEYVWPFLMLTALRDYHARPYVFVLGVMWFVQVSILTLNTGWTGELGSLLMDFWAFGLCAYCMPPRRPRWALLVLWLFGVSFLGQALFWFLEAQGYETVYPHYYFGLGVFSAQLLCVTYPGGKCLVRDARVLIRRVRSRGGDGQPDRVAVHPAQSSTSE